MRITTIIGLDFGNSWRDSALLEKGLIKANSRLKTSKNCEKAEARKVDLAEKE